MEGKVLWTRNQPKIGKWRKTKTILQMPYSTFKNIKCTSPLNKPFAIVQKCPTLLRTYPKMKTIFGCNNCIFNSDSLHQGHNNKKFVWHEPKKKQRYKYDNDDDNDDDGRHEMRIENNWTGMIRKYISLCSMILWCIKYTKQKHWRLYSMPACRHCVAVILADVVKIYVGQRKTMLPVHPRASKVKLWKELLKRKSKAKAVNCNRKPHIEHNTEPHSVPAVYTVNFCNCVNIFKQ